MDITNRYYKHMWLIIALLCSGCASNLLNSERIEKKFGVSEKNNIINMTKLKLKRKIIEENA